MHTAWTGVEGPELSISSAKARPRLPYHHFTSSTLHTASLPAAVCPEEQSILWLGGLALILSALVYRDGVLVMNSVILVMK